MTINEKDFDQLEKDEYWMDLDSFHNIKEEPGIVYIEYEQLAKQLEKSFDAKIMAREKIRVTSTGELRTYIKLEVKNLKETYQALRFSYIYGTF